MAARFPLPAVLPQPFSGRSEKGRTMPPRRTRILVVAHDEKSDWRWLSARMDPEKYEWDFLFLGAGDSSARRLLLALLMPRRLSRYDVVVSFEYFVSFGVNLRLWLLRSRARHICYSFNQSRRLLKFGNRLLDGWINAVFDRARLFVVHSRREQSLFSEIHDLDPRKFYFAHFALRTPTVRPDVFSKSKDKYVCLIGRNNRDIRCFVEALDGLGLKGVVITDRRNADPVADRDGISVHYDLDTNACLDCIRHALANVILVKDDARGAGHITAVQAMLLGKPQVISDVAVLRDYFVDGRHGITVPTGDVAAARRAIAHLLDHPEKASEYGENARRHAETWFSEDREARQVERIIDAVAADQPLPACDPTWLEAHTALQQTAAAVKAATGT